MQRSKASGALWMIAKSAADRHLLLQGAYLPADPRKIAPGAGNSSVAGLVAFVRSATTGTRCGPVSPFDARVATAPLPLTLPSFHVCSLLLSL